MQRRFPKLFILFKPNYISVVFLNLVRYAIPSLICFKRHKVIKMSVFLWSFKFLRLFAYGGPIRLRSKNTLWFQCMCQSSLIKMTSVYIVKLLLVRPIFVECYFSLICQTTPLIKALSFTLFAQFKIIRFFLYPCTIIFKLKVNLFFYLGMHHLSYPHLCLVSSHTLDSACLCHDS